MSVSFVQSMSGKLAFTHLVIILMVGSRESGHRLFSPLPFRTVTWVCLLIVCHGLQKTGHLSDSQMLRNWAKCEDKSQLSISPTVVIFSLCWGHFPLRATCLLMDYEPNSHQFLESGKPPPSQQPGSDFFKACAGLKFPVFVSCFYLSICKIGPRRLILCTPAKYKGMVINTHTFVTI